MIIYRHEVQGSPISARPVVTLQQTQRSLDSMERRQTKPKGGRPMGNVLTIREAVSRVKAEGIPVSEYTLRAWIRTA